MIAWLYAYALGALLTAMFVRWVLHEIGPRDATEEYMYSPVGLWIIPIFCGVIWPVYALAILNTFKDP